MLLKTLPYVLALSSAITAQASIEACGWGCVGGGTGGSYCVSHNPNGGTNSIPRLINEYAYGFTAPSNLVVIGAALFTETLTTNPESTKIAFYFGTSSASTTPSETREAVGEISVDANLRFHEGYFNKPIMVPQGHTFWIGQANSTTVRAAGITSGFTPPLRTYWRRLPSITSWTPTGVVNVPSCKVICLGGGQVTGAPPVLTNVGLPKVGNLNFAVKGYQFPAGMAATIVIGGSDQMWGGIQLPFDMGALGFKGCTLWNSGDILVGAGAANAAGEIQMVLPVLPTIPSGVDFFVSSYHLKANGKLGMTNYLVGKTGT